MPDATTPRSVQVHVSTGQGMDVEWQDGHRSHYEFQFLRDACPCALCDDERTRQGRELGQPPATPPGALPMFREPARPAHTEGVGKYAIRFTWNDGHEHGIYSWDFLRQVCPCAECRAAKESSQGDPAPMISTRRAGEKP